MKTLVSILALTLALAFTVPAFAGDATAAKKAEEQCENHCGLGLGTGTYERAMSAFNPKADIRQRIEDVCFVPEADI